MTSGVIESPTSEEAGHPAVAGERKTQKVHQDAPYTFEPVDRHRTARRKGVVKRAEIESIAQAALSLPPQRNATRHAVGYRASSHDPPDGQPERLQDGSRGQSAATPVK